MNWEQKADDLERGLVDGIIPATFLIDNASSPDWYGSMVRLSERARDVNRLRAMIRGILKRENLGKMVDGRRGKIIGIGSAALHILNLLKDSDSFVENILFLDNDPCSFEKSSFSNLRLPWAKMLFMSKRGDGAYIPLSWGGIHHGGPGLGRLMALGFVEQIAITFEDVNSALIIATLGGATGSGVSPVVAGVLAGVLKEMGVKLNVITQIPFQFEGRGRMENARESLEVIQEYTDNVIVIEGNEVLRRIGHPVTLLDAFKTLDLEVANLIKDICMDELK